MNIYKLIKQVGAGNPTPSKRKSCFGNDSRLAKNILDVRENPIAIEAAKQGILTDHRTIEELRKAGWLAGNIILKIETRLGRKLPRSKAKVLVANYLNIRDQRTSLERTQRYLASIIAGAKCAV